MKRILTATAIAAALAAGSAQAGNTSGTFNVNVTLTSACTLSAVTNVAFAYTSLQAAAANATGGGFSVSCTNTLPYTFGLQAGLFTNDLRLVEAAFDRIEVGGLNVNDVSAFRVDHMPYGGVKRSGLGREGLRYAIEEMTELRLITFNPRPLA